MADVITDFISQYGGQLVNTTINSLLASNNAAAGNAALTQFTNVSKDSMDALIEGQQASLKAREDLGGKLDTTLGNYATDRINTSNVYGTTNANAGTQYGTDVGTSRDAAVGDYATGAGIYDSGMAAALNSGANEIRTGYSNMAETLDPYVTAGEQGLNYLQQQMGLDPAALTPSQQRMADKYLRDSNARLASSGLRGAGRAGVAAVNDGMASLGATFYDQNLARQGAAASSLNSTGYGAAGALATGQKNLGETLGTLVYGTGEKQASSMKDYGYKVGDLKYNSGKDIAATTLNLKQKSADQALNSSNDVSREKLLTKTSYDTALSGAQSDAANNIAAARAKALQTSGEVGLIKDTVNNYQTGKTYRDILNIFANSKPQ